MKNSDPHRISFRARLVVLLPSIIAYLIACGSPAIYFLKNGVEPITWYGVEALGLGCLGVLIGQYGWFANPLVLIAFLLVLFRRFVAASVFAVLALAVATHSLAIFHQHIPADEGDVNRLDAKAFGIGFYFWVASLFVAVVATVLASVLIDRRAREASKVATGQPPVSS